MQMYKPWLPDGIFSNKNANLGKFWRALQWKMVVCLMAIRSILRPIDIFYGHLVHFVVVWYIFWFAVPRKIWQPWYTVRPHYQQIKKQQHADSC
jgi:hypothetical protein